MLDTVLMKQEFILEKTGKDPVQLKVMLFFSCWIKNPTKNPIIVEERFPQILFYHTRFFHVAMWYSIRTNIVALIFQYINMQLLL